MLIYVNITTAKSVELYKFMQAKKNVLCLTLIDFSPLQFILASCIWCRKEYVTLLITFVLFVVPFIF